MPTIVRKQKLTVLFMSFFFFTSLLKYNYFTLLCQFLLYKKVNQLYVYVYPHNPSLLRLPSTLPIPPLQVVTKNQADLTVLCGCFPLAIYFTFGKCFSSKSFIVSGLTFRSLIHLEFIFVYGVRECSNFILLHVALQFSQHHLLKRLSFLHCIFLPPFSKIR